MRFKTKMNRSSFKFIPISQTKATISTANFITTTGESALGSANSSQKSSFCLRSASAAAPSSVAWLHGAYPTRGVARGRTASCLALRVSPSPTTQSISLPLTQCLQELGNTWEMPGHRGEIFLVRRRGLKCYDGTVLILQ